MNQKRVLIVEDDEDILSSLVEFLEYEGCMALQARNGKEALDLLSQAEVLPSLIFLDLMMPVMDGAEFRDRQTKDPRISQIPVILVSADHRADMKRSLLGNIEFLPKPIDIDQFSALLKKYLNQS